MKLAMTNDRTTCDIVKLIPHEVIWVLTPTPAMSGSAPLAQSPFQAAMLSNVTHGGAMHEQRIESWVACGIGRFETVKSIG